VQFSFLVMGMKQAWKRCPRVHAIFLLVCFTFMLYSNLADPMARSLVVCDEPLNASIFTGSSRCGDRLLVIERGQELVAGAKVVRLGVTVASATALGVVADVRGRKAFLMIYLIAMLASVLCNACTVSLEPTEAWFGFMAAAAFAGFFSVDQNGYRLILADMAEADGDKSKLGDLYQLQVFSQALSSAAGLGASLVVTSLHFTSYSGVCLPIAGLLGACMLLVASMEEPRSESKRVASAGPDAEHASVLDTMRETVRLLKGNEYLRRKLPIMMCGGVVESFGAVLAPFTMAVYGWEQASAGKLIVIGAPMMMICLGLSMPIARRIGERRAVSFCLWIGIVAIPPLLLLLPLSTTFLHITHALLIMNQTLPRCLLSAVDIQLTDEGIRARFNAALSVGKMTIGMVMQPIVSWLFDATAKDYLTQVRPIAIMAIFVFAVNFMQIFPPCGPMYMEGLDAMTADRLAKADRSEGSQAAAGESKKED